MEDSKLEPVKGRKKQSKTKSKAGAHDQKPDKDREKVSKKSNSKKSNVDKEDDQDEAVDANNTALSPEEQLKKAKVSIKGLFGRANSRREERRRKTLEMTVDSSGNESKEEDANENKGGDDLKPSALGSEDNEAFCIVDGRQEETEDSSGVDFEVVPDSGKRKRRSRGNPRKVVSESEANVSKKKKVTNDKKEDDIQPTDGKDLSNKSQRRSSRRTRDKKGAVVDIDDGKDNEIVSVDTEPVEVEKEEVAVPPPIKEGKDIR